MSDERSPGVDRVVEVVEERAIRDREQGDDARFDGLGTARVFAILRDAGESVDSTEVRASLERAVREGRLVKLQGKHMEWWRPWSGASRAASYYFTREGLAERERALQARREAKEALAEAEEANEKSVAWLSEKLGVELRPHGSDGVVIPFDELKALWLESVEPS